MCQKLSMRRGKQPLILTVLALLALLVTPMLALAAGQGPEGYTGSARAATAPATNAKSMTALSAAAASSAGGDGLYVGDFNDDTVKRFDTQTGAYLNTFVASGSGGLLGPRGLIFFGGQLDVVNQNLQQPFPGEILQYDVQTGQFIKALVGCNPPIRSCDPNAPFAPQGLIAGPDHTVYVADQGDFGSILGRIAQYDSVTGKFLGNLSTAGFTGALYPRGLVMGPDDLLYVSLTGNLQNGDNLPGSIVRFSPRTGKFVGVFTSNQAAGCAADLHRPYSLVFGPDGNLYVGAFRADPSDTDKILVFDGKTGACVKKIDLDQVGQGRTYSNGMVFGPGGRLFVGIFTTGDVRRYNVADGSFDVFVSSGGALGLADHLVFRSTNPRTLAYGQ